MIGPDDLGGAPVATMSGALQRAINDVPDPTTRRTLQILVQYILDELEGKADKD
jgi:hypothetical protein